MTRILATTLMLSCSLHAASVTLDFDVTITSLPATPLPAGSTVVVGQMFSGQVSYDDSLVAPSGPSILTPSSDPAITLEFVFDGFAYGASDDVNAPFGPELSFSDGVLTGFAFDADAKLPSAAPDSVVQFEAEPFSFLFSYDGGFTNGLGTGVIVPEPGSAMLLLLGGMLWTVRRRN